MATRLQRELKQTKPFRSPGHEASVALLRTADVVRRSVGLCLEPYGITPAQYNVLRILRGAGSDGLSIHDVAHRLIERNPGITRMMDRLERNGWVRRVRQEEDRRVVFCYLTPTGRRLLKRLDHPVETADDQVVANFTDAEVRKLLKLLEHIREHLK